MNVNVAKSTLPVSVLLFALFCLMMVVATYAQTGPDIPSTALLVTPENEPRAVLGDDGYDHIEYNLLVTNVLDAPVTLSSVDVTDESGNQLMRLEGQTLAAATQTVIRVLGQATPGLVIPVSGSATVEIDLILPPNTAPAHLSHHIPYTIPDNDPLASVLGRDEVVGPDIAVAAAPAMTVLPPLVGAGWVTLNGCCTPFTALPTLSNVHRDARLAASTRIGSPEIFAIDFLRVTGGRLFKGNGTTNQQWFGFGATVYSVAAGEVVATHDGMQEDIPFEFPTLHTPQEFGGNFVIVRIAPDVYASYFHLMTGSVAVSVGDHVAAGDKLGQLGNSGNTTAPHLHFTLLDRPDPITGYSLPFVFANYELTGLVTGQKGNDVQIEDMAEPVSSAYPLVNSIATYK